MVVGYPLQLLASSGSLGSEAQAIAFRVSSLGTSESLQESSYQTRVGEDDAATASLAHDPLFGTGVGQPYGAQLAVHDPLTNRTQYVDKLFIHNQFLRVWLWFGLPGIAGLVALGVWMTVAQSIARRLPDSEAGGVAFAAASAILALGVQAMYQTSLLKPAVIAAFGAPLCSYKAGPIWTATMSDRRVVVMVASRWSALENFDTRWRRIVLDWQARPDVELILVDYPYWTSPLCCRRNSCNVAITVEGVEILQVKIPSGRNGRWDRIGLNRAARALSVALNKGGRGRTTTVIATTPLVAPSDGNNSNSRTRAQF